MRILFLTNFYPPYELGGQGQSCQQVVEGLAQRGHTTLVLTSMHGTDNVPTEEDGISRSLYLEMDFAPWRHAVTFFTGRNAREAHNLRRFRHVCTRFDPDVVFIWGMWNLPRSLPALAEAMYPGNVVYRFAEYWPTLPSQHELYWRTPGRTWYSHLFKRVVGTVALALLARNDRRPPLRFEHAFCVSASTRQKLLDAGIPVADARIIHTGLDVERFLNGDTDVPPTSDADEFRLLYAGRLSADKGVDTAISAVSTLVHEYGLPHVSLSVAGSGAREYEAVLRRLVAEEELAEHVSFLGHVPSEQMPELFRQSDVLVVPSTWPEPFARVVLEGMVSELVVVATPMGGTAEILNDDENGLLFAAGDADDLAQQVARLVADATLRRRLARAGRQTVMQQFTVARMLDEIEAYLEDVAGRTPDQTARTPQHGQEVLQ